MNMLLLVGLLWSCVHPDRVVAQQWVTPRNRVMYSLDGRSENLSWHMNYDGKELFNARWTAYNDVKGTKVVLISVLRGTRKSVFHPKVTTLRYMTFNATHFAGDFDVRQLKSDTFHRVGCVVTFRNVDEQYEDFVTIRYAGYEPVLSQSLPPKQTYLEGEESVNKVEIKGNPKPIVIWKHKNKELVSTPRMRIVTEERIDDENNTIVTSVLHIQKVMDRDTGLVQVIGKYGDKYTKSPDVTANMVLDVQFSPRNMSFTSNVTSARLLRNDNFVKLICDAKGNPPPTYKVTKAVEVVYEGQQARTVYHISGIHEGRHAWFRCAASNNLGGVTMDMTLPLDLDEGELVLRSNFARPDSTWLKYFIIGAVLLLLIFLIISLVSFVVRSRMRSMTITDESTITKMSSSSQIPSYKLSCAAVTSSHEEYPAIARDLSNRAPSRKNRAPSRNNRAPSRNNRAPSRKGERTNIPSSSFNNEGMQRSQELSDIPGPSSAL